MSITLSSIIDRLTAPFPTSLIALKPGALNREKNRGLALAYADTRAYQDRLDACAGAEGWSATFTLTPNGAVCTLTMLGVTKSDVGDYPLASDDENPATSAAAQAFKRACAMFGLGRYLYALPRMWGDYDDERRTFVDPQRLVAELYRAAGLASSLDEQPCPTPAAPDRTAADTFPAAPSATPSRTLVHRAAPERVEQARSVLASSEQRTGVAPYDNDHAPQAQAHETTPTPASDRQLGFIIKLIIELVEAGIDERVNGLGASLDITDLATLRSRPKLAALHLSMAQATYLINELKALVG